MPIVLNGPEGTVVLTGPEGTVVLIGPEVSSESDVRLTAELKVIDDFL